MRNISVEELLKHSFVISVNNEQLKFFNTVFQSMNLTPLPKVFSGFQAQYFDSIGIGQISPRLTKLTNCTFSHAAIIKIAQQLDWPFVCIFEDDAFPINTVIEELQYYLTDIPTNIHAISFGCNRYYINDTRRINNKYLGLKRNYGSHSYIVFKEGYNEYFDALKTGNSTADMVFDRLTNMFTTTRILFVQCPIYSDTISGHHTLFHRGFSAAELAKYFPNPNKFMHCEQPTKSLSIQTGGRFGNILFQVAHAISSNKLDNAEKLQINLDSTRWYPVELPQNIFENVVFVKETKPKIIFSGYYQSEQYFNSPEIKRLFKVKQELIDKYRKKYSYIDFNNSVAIHIRRGDYLNSDTYVHLEPTYFVNAYNKYFSKVQPLIFSDDINWCKDNIKIPNAIYISNTSMYEDFILISMCKHHICSNSTFPWWAAFIGEQSDSINVFPSKWFTNTQNQVHKDIEQNIVPSRWIKENV